MHTQDSADQPATAPAKNKYMFNTNSSNSLKICTEFATKFQKCLALRDLDMFDQLIDHNSSGLEGSQFFDDNWGVLFSDPKDMDFTGEVLSESDNCISIYFYVGFEGDFREAIAEFDLTLLDDHYVVHFLAFKPS